MILSDFSCALRSMAAMSRSGYQPVTTQPGDHVEWGNPPASPRMCNGLSNSWGRCGVELVTTRSAGLASWGGTELVSRVTWTVVHIRSKVGRHGSEVESSQRGEWFWQVAEVSQPSGPPKPFQAFRNFRAKSDATSSAARSTSSLSQVMFATRGFAHKWCSTQKW